MSAARQRFESVNGLSPSIDPLKAPHRDGWRQLTAVIDFRPHHLPQLLQSVTADGDVIVLAAGITDGVPDSVELFGLLEDRVELPPAGQLQRLADVDVPAIGAVESQQVVHRDPIGEAKTI